MTVTKAIAPQIMHRLALILLFICMTGGVGSAGADDDYLEARDLVRAGTILPLERILERAQGEHPGRVLEVELEAKHDRYVYEIELLDVEGRVWELYYDASTGEFLKRKEED